MCWSFELTLLFRFVCIHFRWFNEREKKNDEKYTQTHTGSWLGTTNWKTHFRKEKCQQPEKNESKMKSMDNKNVYIEKKKYTVRKWYGV